jgi:hypothetical protein
MNAEIRPIPSFPGYGVRKDGSLWSRKRPGSKQLRDEWRRLSTTKVFRHGKPRYEQTSLARDGRLVPVHIHRMVLEAFIGPCPEGCEARHLNGDSFDNRLENLQWGTKIENSEDKRRHGTMQSCERNGQAKLTRTEVEAIRQLRPSTTLVVLASQFGVSSSQIKRIVYGKSWTD